jgi:hypothetical protein
MHDNARPHMAVMTQTCEQNRITLVKQPPYSVKYHNNTKPLNT